MGAGATGEKLRFHGTHICRLTATGKSQRLDVSRQGSQHLRAVRIIGIDHRKAQATLGKKLLLAARVGRHVAVVIEMVVREIGKHGNVKLHTLHAPLVQRVG